MMGSEDYTTNDEKLREMERQNMPSRESNMVDRLQKLSFENAKKKGWDEPLSEAKSFGDWVALMHTEISEAYEDYRTGHKLDEIYYELDGDPDAGRKYTFEEKQKIARAWWHAEESPRASEAPVFKPCGIPIEMADEVIRILHLAEFAGFNLYNCIEMKMDYNQRRSFRHGGKKT